MPAPASSDWPSPTVTLWGAAQEVTGSMHRVAVAGRRLLLDCGLLMEKKAENRGRNAEFPFDPYRLDAVLLSHAHLDHSGNLPNLVRKGFAGPIYCTRATRDLLRVMLPDSARIQEEDAVRHNAARARGTPWVEPLYAFSDVDDTLEQVQVVEYGETLDLGNGVRGQFLPAGHVLGSAMVHLEWRGAGRPHRLTYTADLGRPSLPLHAAPAPLPPADLLLCEATYGGRVHEPWPQMLEALRTVASSTRQRGGKLLIPAFSLGRTQLLVHAFQRLFQEGRLPRQRVYIDSPLAVAITRVYQQHVEELAEPLAREFAEHRTDFLAGPEFTYLRTQEDSRMLNDLAGPAIIIASSGMSEGGRVVHHLRRLIDDPRATVLLVSFQASGTLGARMQEPGPTLRIHGKDFNKWADVVTLRGFSAHADQNDLVAKVQELDPAGTRVVLVHGDPEQAGALQGRLREGGWNVSQGEYGQSLEW